MTASRLVLLIAMPLVLAGCSGASSSSSAGPASTHTRPSSRTAPPSPTYRSRTPAPATTRTTTAPAPSGATKVLVFIVENHSMAEMRSQMPWTDTLGQRYGYATDFHAMTHPSLPNYLAIAGGSTFGVQDDHPPPAHPIGSPSVFGEALAHGLTARVYADAMPAPCTLTDTGQYLVRHNPWTYFTAERRECEEDDVPLDQFAGDVRSGHLPDAGMVVPDRCHDAHDCSLAVADAWLRQEVGLAMSGPDFRAGRLAIVVTGDEDDGSQDNVVLTILIHPSLRNVVATGPLSHVSLSRLYSEVLGLPPLREAASAPSMAQAFGLALGH